MTLGIFSHFSPCMHPKARYIRDITTPPFLRQKTLIKKPIKAATSNAGDLINWLCTKGGAYIFWGSRASLVLICKKQRFAWCTLGWCDGAQQKVLVDPEAATWPRAKFHQLKSRSLAHCTRSSPESFSTRKALPRRLAFSAASFASVLCAWGEKVSSRREIIIVMCRSDLLALRANVFPRKNRASERTRDLAIFQSKLLPAFHSITSSTAFSRIKISWRHPALPSSWIGKYSGVIFWLNVRFSIIGVDSGKLAPQ